jgi:hypothetical protein
MHGFITLAMLPPQGNRKIFSKVFVPAGHLFDACRKYMAM